MKLKLMGIKYDSVMDGFGVRSVVFTAGCGHFCRGCQNPRSWNIENGEEYSIDRIIDELEFAGHRKVTLSGGDPMYQIEETCELVCRLKELGYDVWMYTGYTKEELELMDREDIRFVLNHLDGLVDGRFVLDDYEVDLELRGSRNQRVYVRKDGDLEVYL